VLPNITYGKFNRKTSRNICMAVDIAMRHYDILNALIAESQLVGLQRAIEATPDYTGKFLVKTERDRRGNDRLYVSLKRFESLDDDEWPVRVVIVKPASEDDESDRWSRKQRIRIAFKIHPILENTASDEAWAQVVGEVRRRNREGQEWLRLPWRELENQEISEIRTELNKLLDIEVRLHSTRAKNRKQ